MGVLTTCDLCGELISAPSLTECLCDFCAEISREVDRQATEDADLDDSGWLEAEADAWHSQYD